MQMPAPEPSAASNPRIDVVDGLRAVAVIGVIWWHSWIHSSNPGLILNLGGLDINLQRLLVPLGNGFNLFFVLSGFCIRLSLERLVRAPSWSGGWRFLVHRWWRLTPAFYATVIGSFAVYWIYLDYAPWRALIPHALWLYGVIPYTPALAPQFWTLQVEWEFYLLAPALLLLLPRATLRWAAIVLLAAASLWYRARLALEPVLVNDAANSHLPTHFIEFAWGLGIAEWKIRLGDRARVGRHRWFFFGGLLLAYLGRGLQTTEVWQRAGSLGPLAKALSEPVMTAGFACVLIAALSSSGTLTRVLQHPWLQTIGRWSYGLYLWHWWPCLIVGVWLREHWGVSVGIHYLTMAVTLLITLPLAHYTYEFLEKPFMSAGKPRPKPSNQAATPPVA